jgi:para-nitrobenzyl esterase
VPVLVGSNRDESFGATPSNAAQFAEQVRRRYGDGADSFLTVYPGGSDEQAKESAFFAGRDEMAWVMRNWARMEAKTGKSKAYIFFFTHQPPVQTNAKGGKFAPGARGTAVHTSEIPYVFNNLRGNRAWTDVDRQVADAMSSYWVNFAATGDPNGKGLPKWLNYDEGKNKSAMEFGDKPAMASPPNEAQLAVFQAYYDKLYAH